MGNRVSGYHNVAVVPSRQVGKIYIYITVASSSDSGGEVKNNQCTGDLTCDPYGREGSHILEHIQRDRNSCDPIFSGSNAQ